MNETKEEWRSVVGYEGYYEVSNLGRVRSLDRVVNSKGGIRTIPGRIIRLRHNKQGYNIATLVKDRSAKTLRVARLVAMAFIPNDNNLPEVNHKDETRDNDKSSNLEWCTHEYNMRYGCRLKRMADTYKRKQISMLKNGVEIRRFDSAHDAARFLGNDRWQGNISAWARGYGNTAYGYEWRYVVCA